MKRHDVLLLALLVPCVALIILFGFDILPIADDTLKRLLQDAIPRFSAGAYLVFLMILKGYGGSFHPKWRIFHLLWAVPCLAVAAVNFPFSALISGKAVIKRGDLLWLFLLKCFSVALLEESFFRALLVPVLKEKRGDLFAVLVSAALFGAMHLINLFSGNVGAVFLQVGYTFLLGCMFAVMLLRTGNVWLCVLVHFLFDVGGTIVADLGGGSFQDTIFWILTAAVGALCAVHILVSFIRLEKRKQVFEDPVHKMNDD